MHDILLVEDDDEIADFILLGLTNEGYNVRHANSAAAMWEVLAERQVSLIVLDRMLPDAEGAILCETLRDTHPDLFILMLTAKDSLEDKLAGLRSGADDYITKPFSFEELLLRLEALLRRREGGISEKNGTLSCGVFEFDLTHKSVQREGRELGLTPTEFALLKYLADNAGNVVSRMDILSGVWGKNFDPNTNIVEVYIAYLRRKADGPFDEKMIRNVRGFGYVLEV
ncbi:response regulator transcription factor [Celeribacter sp.]|uniref:response regulator transcription factor n=1 Tax=Celeribacter sp. TaxID=1890673 RepID=UPI003A92E63E